jgi:uncharacterized protein (DUF885 family)
MTAIFDRRQFLGTAAAAGLLAGCKVAKAPGGTAEGDLANRLQGMAEQMLAEYPENATIIGIATGAREPLNHRLTDRTPEGVAARASAARRRLAELKTLDLSDLGKSTNLDAAVALTAHQIADEGFAFGFGDPINLDPNIGFRNTPYVVNQLGGAFIDFPDFLDSRHSIANEQDAVAYADRVDAYAKDVDGETERLAHDRGLGVIAPDFTLDKTIGIIGSGAGEKPENSTVVTSLQKSLAKARLDDRITDRVKQSMASGVIPALQRQLDELKRHRAAATSDAGVWHFKNGDAYYHWALKAGTTTAHSPEEVHKIGLDQVKEIQARMDSIMQKHGMTGGTVGERIAALGKDPSQLYPNTAAGREQLLAYLNGRIADIRTRLPRAFATLVPGRLIIKRVPPSIEAGAPGGYAAAGSVDGKVPGQYYINLRDTSEWPRFSLPTLCYHEGIPGHIWQGDYANRMPLIRSMLAFNAYSEGWALYAEQLADELGVYDNDPMGELGYLQSMGFRACRLVVDTGLHAMRWTRDQAIDWFAKTNGDPRASVTAEVDRYCSMPGQACGYKLGHLEIVGMRAKAQKMLGARYDLRKFDDAVVKGGNVPLTLLGTVIDRFIAQERSA